MPFFYAQFPTCPYMYFRVKSVTGFLFDNNMNNFLQIDFSPVSLLKLNLVVINKIRSAFISCPQIDNSLT